MKYLLLLSRLTLLSALLRMVLRRHGLDRRQNAGRCERFTRWETLYSVVVPNAVFVVYSGWDSGFDSISEECFYASSLVLKFDRVYVLRAAFNGGAGQPQSR